VLALEEEVVVEEEEEEEEEEVVVVEEEEEEEEEVVLSTSALTQVAGSERLYYTQLSEAEMRSWDTALLMALTACLLTGEHQRRLYKDLMANYNPLERPVFNDSHSLTYWIDHYLQWNTSEYPGVTNVRFPDALVWKPDILLYNSADERFDATFHTNVLSTCHIDVRWFPFDVQRCDLKFGSWTYGGWSLDLQMMEADTTGYIANGEWDLVETPGRRSERFYDCCREPYPDVTFSVVMRRRTLYYGLNLLIPCYFATTMVIVGLSVIATVLVLQYHHHDPDGGKMPKWTRVVLLNWCAWFLRMKRPGEARVRPACHNKTTRGSLTSVDLNASSSAAHLANSSMLYIGFRGLERVPYSTTTSEPASATSPDSGVAGCGRAASRAGGEGEALLPACQSSLVSSLEQELGKILDELRYIGKRFRDQDEEESLCNEWKFAAAVIDRLCLMAFSLFTVLCTIGILMSAPNFVEAISKDFFT
ncbi:hypothetical protein CRUP_034403, partial [Coryphaenoides rupestris]